jgi:hypothetical protein
VAVLVAVGFLLVGLFTLANQRSGEDTCEAKSVWMTMNPTVLPDSSLIELASISECEQTTGICPE